MAPLDGADRERVISLLVQVKRLVVPQCQRTGEELAFSARRDSIVDEALAVLHYDVHDKSIPDEQERIIVNQHELANSVIQNTFDQHKNLLRMKLRDAEAEVQKWKQIAAATSPCGVNSLPATRGILQSETVSSPTPTYNELISRFLDTLTRWNTSAMLLFSNYLAAKEDALWHALEHLACETIPSSCPRCAQKEEEELLRVPRVAESHTDGTEHTGSIEDGREHGTVSTLEGGKSFSPKRTHHPREKATTAAKQAKPRLAVLSKPKRTSLTASTKEKHTSSATIRFAAPVSAVQESSTLYAISSMRVSARNTSSDRSTVLPKLEASYATRSSK